MSTQLAIELYLLSVLNPNLPQGHKLPETASELLALIRKNQEMRAKLEEYQHEFSFMGGTWEVESKKIADLLNKQRGES